MQWLCEHDFHQERAERQTSFAEPPEEEKDMKHKAEAQRAQKTKTSRLDAARARWEHAWLALQTCEAGDVKDLGYNNIPWPAVSKPGQPINLSLPSLRRYLTKATREDRLAAQVHGQGAADATALRVVHLDVWTAIECDPQLAADAIKNGESSSTNVVSRSPSQHSTFLRLGNQLLLGREHT